MSDHLEYGSNFYKKKIPNLIKQATLSLKANVVKGYGIVILFYPTPKRFIYYAVNTFFEVISWYLEISH